jgi:hypothetical protein
VAEDLAAMEAVHAKPDELAAAVLLKVYAKCVDGEEEAARQRIEAALQAA